MLHQFYLMRTVLMFNSPMKPQYVSLSAISSRGSCAGQLSFLQYIYICIYIYIYIFQSSLEQKKVLTLWKEAIVVPVDEVTSPKSLLSPRGPRLPCNENV